MKDILKKIMDLDEPLSNEELDIIIEHYKILSELLEIHGLLYHLIWKDTYLKLHKYKEIKENRIINTNI